MISGLCKLYLLYVTLITTLLFSFLLVFDKEMCQLTHAYSLPYKFNFIKTVIKLTLQTKVIILKHFIYLSLQLLKDLTYLEVEITEHNPSERPTSRCLTMTVQVQLIATGFLGHHYFQLDLHCCFVVFDCS